MRKIKKFRLVFLGILLGCALGYSLSSFLQSDQKVIETKLQEKTETIAELELKIKTLKEESLKESTKTVIVEKSDGSRTTTKIRNFEKLNSTSKIAEKENKELESVLRNEDNKVTITNSLRNNALGVRVVPSLSSFSVQVQPYVRAGTKCLVFSCYAEAAYSVIDQKGSIALGLEYRF